MSLYNNINTDLNQFEGFGTNRNFDPLVTGHTFVFFTRPQLNILDKYIAKNGNAINPEELATQTSKETAYVNIVNGDKSLNLFGDYDAHKATQRDKTLLHYLSYYYNPAVPDDKRVNGDLTNNNIFIPLLTNRSKGFEPKDIMLETTEMYQTRDQHKILLPYTDVRSLSADQFSLSFDDTENADITKMMYLWVQYISGINKGNMIANQDMVNAGIYDFFSSMYFFKLSADCTKLLYWSKYTGVFPINVPIGAAFRDTKGQHDIAEVNIAFGYSFKEEYTMDILRDFNAVSLNVNWKETNSDTYNKLLTASAIKNQLGDSKLQTPIIGMTTDKSTGGIEGSYYTLYLDSMTVNLTPNDIISNLSLPDDGEDDTYTPMKQSHFVNFNKLYGYDAIMENLIQNENNK